MFLEVHPGTNEVGKVNPVYSQLATLPPALTGLSGLHDCLLEHLFTLCVCHTGKVSRENWNTTAVVVRMFLPT